MKISYERLNQIIEEEVVRFKKLNEQVEELETTKQIFDDVKSLKSVIDSYVNKKSKNLTDLQALYTKLGGKVTITTGAVPSE